MKQKIFIKMVALAMACLLTVGFVPMWSVVAATKEVCPTTWAELRERLRAAGASEYAVKNAANLIRSFDDMCMHSVVVYHDTPLEDLYQMVELAAEEMACAVFLFHRTRKPGEADYDSPWSYDYDSFVEFAGYLAKRRDEGAILVQTAREAYLTSRSGGDQS